MKAFITMASILFFSCCSISFGRDDSIAKGITPKFYKKRNNPVLNIALVYYGSYYTDADLERVQKLLEKRFFLATNSSIQINTLTRLVIPYRHNIINFPEYRQEYVLDKERLQRLWYYDNVGLEIINEVYDVVKIDHLTKSQLKNIDALLIVTGAQFDALGFASGRVAITENPMEIAWGLPGGGHVDFVSDEKVVDELLHEIGHVMFLDHASSQCHRPGMTAKETADCCAESPAKNDVMSYCRKRNQVNENIFYGYEACNLKTIKEKIVPAMLKGGRWNIQDREKCL